MGKAVIRAGEAGAGQAAKICNNMLLAVHMIGTCEAMNLAMKLGLDPQNFYDIASKASGQTWSLTSYCPVPGPVPAAPSNRGYKPGFAAPMMLKDLKLAQATAEEAGVETPMGARARDIYQQFNDEGGAELDFSGVIKLLAGELGSGVK
jgi:3-hydroxyisobutyrate dehydrogenase